MTPSWLAQGNPTLPEGLDLIGGSVLGAVLLMLIFGWLWAKPAVDALKDENRRLNETLDTKNAELASLRAGLDEKVIPLIEKNTYVVERVIGLLEQRVDVDRRVKDQLERLDPT